MQPDGSVSLTGVTPRDPVGMLIGEFFYTLTDPAGNTSDSRYVEVFIR